VAKRKSECYGIADEPADLNIAQIVVTYTARNRATPQPCFVDVTDDADEPPVKL